MSTPVVRSRGTPRAPSPRAGGSRGITLIELMAVVVIIGIFAALAAPAIAGQLADRHAARAAEDVSALFRIARSRSASTGAAHAVVVTASGTTLRFELRAAVNPADTVNGAPISRCLTPRWDNLDSRLLAAVDLDAGSYQGRGVVARRTTAAVDYCITPGGTPWYRDSAGQWSHPNGSQYGEFQIVRNDAAGVQRGVTRIVRVGPTGAPRIDVGG